jgi:hypothetical protein
MSLADDLQQNTEPKPPWQTCSVAWAISLTDGENKTALIRAINGRHMSGDKIAKAVRDNLSLAMSGESIRRHRRQSCRCEK